MADKIERVMVVTAHPDDSEFGAGGTVAKMAKEGREVTYVIVTNGNKGSSDRSMTPERLHGRLMGAVESLSALSIALGLPLGGALVAISSPRIAFATIGAGTVGAAIALLHASKRGREAAGDAGECRAERQTTEQLEQAARHESAARG